MNEIVNLINSVGFPIIGCVFMYNQLIKMNEIVLELTTTLKGIDTRLENLERKGEE